MGGAASGLARILARGRRAVYRTIALLAVGIGLHAHASEPLLPPLVCFIDSDSQVTCIDTLFLADTIIDCGGNRDLFAYDGGEGVLSIGYTDAGGAGPYVELMRARYSFRTWQAADNALLVYYDETWLGGSSFETCWRYSYFHDPGARWPAPVTAGSR